MHSSQSQEPTTVSGGSYANLTLIGSGGNDLPGIFAPSLEDRGCEDSRSSGAAGDSVRQAPAAHREL